MKIIKNKKRRKKREKLIEAENMEGRN